MKPHPLTLNFAMQASEQPAVNMPGHDLSALEQQIHGFDSALVATGQFHECERFNRVFSRFIASKLGHSQAHSWSANLLEHYGATHRAVDRLQLELVLFKQACAQ